MPRGFYGRGAVTVVSHFFWNWYLFRKRPWVWKLAWGGVLPDLPYIVLLGYYSLQLRVNGLLDLSAWDRAWRHPLVWALHSFVPCLLVGGLAYVTVRRLWLTWWPLWAGWLSHVVLDMLTHRSDGYPIFYPLSDYRFPTPVSYWEPAYHGHAFMIVNDSLVLALLVRHFVVRRRTARLALR